MNAIIALASALCVAVYYVYVSYVMKSRSRVSSGLVLAAGHLVAAMALLPMMLIYYPNEWKNLLTPPSLNAMLAASVLLVISRQLYYYAYAKTDVANITVFSALTPVYALLVGYVVLGETPMIHSLLGLLLICGGVYSIFLKSRGASSFSKHITSPFVLIFQSRPVAMAFLSTIPTAFAAVYQKQLLATIDPITFSAVLLLLVGIASAALEIAKGLANFFRSLSLLPWHFYVMSALMLAATHVLFCLVMQTQPTSISLVLQRSAIVFQILFAYILLKEKQDIKKRMIAACVIMVGFAMILWGG